MFLVIAAPSELLQTSGSKISILPSHCGTAKLESFLAFNRA